MQAGGGQAAAAVQYLANGRGIRATILSGQLKRGIPGALPRRETNAIAPVPSARMATKQPTLNQLVHGSLLGLATVHWDCEQNSPRARPRPRRQATQSRTRRTTRTKRRFMERFEPVVRLAAWFATL